MDAWLVLLLVMGLGLAAFLVWRVDLCINLQARGEPDGMFAAAGGVKLGPLLGTFALAKHVPLRVELQLLGKRWDPRRARKQAERASDDKGEPREPAESHSRGQARQRWAFFKQPWFDPVKLAQFLFDERRRLRVRELTIDLEYSFSNVALTGQLLGAIAALSAFLPAPIELRQYPSWELTSRACLAVDGRIRLWPALLLWDALRLLGSGLMLRKSKQGREARPGNAHGR